MSIPDGTNPDARPEITDAGVEKTEPKVDYEKRFKDTQGAFTKSQQELKAAQAKLEVLEKLTVPQVELDEETKTELDNLKYSDPDAWRNKINTLETEALNAHKQTLTEAEKVANQEMELANRANIFAEFQANNPEIVIDDDTIKYDVPPRITNKLESGEIGFEAYLEEIKTYLNKGKVVGTGETVLAQPDLSKVGGDDTPTDGAVKFDIAKDYENISF